MELKKGYQSDTARAEISKLTIELEMLYHDEAVYWQQRGMAAWLKDGDRNTTFFHGKATVREQANKINGLENENGVRVDEKDQMEAVVAQYFGGSSTRQILARERLRRRCSHWYRG